MYDLNELEEQRKIPKIVDCGDAEYHLVGQLGSGSFSSVFSSVECCKNVRKVRAVKVLSHSKVPIEHIEREIAAHRKCYFHPNVMKLNRVFNVHGYTYMVMPKMRGSVADMGRISEDRVRVLFKQMVNAVAHVHMQNVVHHDIKMENFMFDESDNVYLSDFGLSECVNGEKRTCRMCGTPSFLAPEIVRDIFRDYDMKPLEGHSFGVDIWSLGVCLYWMIAGRRPFSPSKSPEHASLVEQIRLYYSILEDDPPTLNGSTHAKMLIAGMLQKDPSQRITIAEILKHPFFVGV